jgi:hypothetical protein
MYQLAKSTLALRIFSLISWTRVFLRVYKCSSFIAVSAEDAGISVCFSYRKSDFVDYVPTLSSISSSFASLSPKFSVFPCCLEWSLLLENFHLFKTDFFNLCTRKLCSRFAATLSVGSVFSKYEYIWQKHAALQRYSHSDCGVAERLKTEWPLREIRYWGR